MPCLTDWGGGRGKGERGGESMERGGGYGKRGRIRKEGEDTERGGGYGKRGRIQEGDGRVRTRITCTHVLHSFSTCRLQTDTGQNI